MSITTSKTVVDNLLPDTEYYLRIKSHSTDKESTWSYYDNSGKGKFKTSLEQIFDDVHESHVGIDNISLSWRKGAEVTDIRYFIGGDKDNYKTYTLSEDEIEAGEVVLYDLESSTYYTFEIYNGEIKRGSYSAFTKDMDPGEAKEIVLPTGTDISQEYLDDLARLYTNVTLILQPGAEINWNKRDFSGDASLEGGYTIPDKLSITIKGIDPNNKSVINVNGDSDVVQQTGCIEIEGAHPLISFENIRFEHKGSFYLINEEQRFNIGTLSFINCEMNNFTNAIIRLKGSESKKISNLIFDDCIIKIGRAHV